MFPAPPADKYVLDNDEWAGGGGEFGCAVGLLDGDVFDGAEPVLDLAEEEKPCVELICDLRKSVSDRAQSAVSVTLSSCFSRNGYRFFSILGPFLG